MNFSFELINRQTKQKSSKLKLLTQPRQNNEVMKSSSNEFRITSTKYAQIRKQTLNAITSKKTLTSHKSINRKMGRWLGNSYNSASIKRVDIVKDQMNTYLNKNQEKMLSKNIIKVLDQIFQIGEYINSNFYNYGIIEAKIKILNEKIKLLKSYSCQFYCYCISGLILYEYCSLSLTIFYFDKALKTLLNKPIYCFDCKFQLLAYKYTSKVFLQIRKLKQAKDMAYMYLRKTWRYNNIDEEMCAYDLLGQIELEEGNIQMSRYFHWRMCHAIKEQKQILHISNQELDKRDKSQIQLTVYQNIMTFVKNEEQIVSILSNHFKSEAQQQAKGFIKGKKNKQILMYTHRSSNRVLRNHRILQRKLIDEKQSNQLHFIRPKDLKKLRKLITEFNSFIFDLKRQEQLDIQNQQFGFMNQSESMTIQNF